MGSKASSSAKVNEFVLDNELVYPWWVYVYSPDPATPQMVKAKFLVHFEHCSPEERMNYLEEFRKHEAARLQLNEDVQDEATIAEVKQAMTFQKVLLMKKVRSFEKVKDKHGEYVDGTTEENKAKLFDNAWAGDATYKAMRISLQSRDPQGN